MGVCSLFAPMLQIAINIKRIFAKSSLKLNRFSRLCRFYSSHSVKDTAHFLMGRFQIVSNFKFRGSSRLA